MEIKQRQKGDKGKGSSGRGKQMGDKTVASSPTKNRLAPASPMMVYDSSVCLLWVGSEAV